MHKVHPAWLIGALLTSAGEAAVSPPCQPDVIASYRGGVLLNSDYVAWLAAQGQQDSREGRGAIVERLLVVRELASRAERQGLDREAPVLADLAAARQARLMQFYGRELERAVVVSEGEIDSYLEEHRAELVKPRRVRLYNLFKKVPEDASAASRAAVRAATEALRRRAVAGEDFSTLARQESDSQTRWQGGLLGNVPEGTLAPAVEAVAFSLPPGGISDVLESRDGFTVLRVERLIPGRTLSIAEARDMIRQGLYTRKIEASRRELREAAVGPPSGFAERPDIAAALEATRQERLAETLLERSALAKVREPSETEIGAEFAAHRDDYLRPARFDLSLLRFEFSLPTLRAQAALAESSRAAIIAGTISFEEVARRHSDHPSSAQGGYLGWTDEFEVARLGPFVLAALTPLSVGELSPAVQQDSAFYLLRVKGREAARRSELGEARSAVAQTLRRAWMKQEVDKARREAQQGLAIVLGCPKISSPPR